MSAFHAQSAWKFIELFPLLVFNLVGSLKCVSRTVLMVIRWCHLVSVYLFQLGNEIVTLAQLGNETATLEGSRDARFSDAALRDAPAMVIECNAEGLQKADSSERTVRRSLRSYPKLW